MPPRSQRTEREDRKKDTLTTDVTDCADFGFGEAILYSARYDLVVRQLLWWSEFLDRRGWLGRWEQLRSVFRLCPAAERVGPGEALETFRRRF